MDNLFITGWNLWLHDIQLFYITLYINPYELATL